VGGIGSGEWGHRRYNLNDCLKLDIRKILRNRWSGRLKWLDGDGECQASIRLQLGFDSARLKYSFDGEPRHYDIPLAGTPCNYGGKRLWFRCPGRGCGRRTAVLYCASGWFVCRRCARLKYASQSEPRSARMQRKRDKILRSMGIDPYSGEDWAKPPRMQWHRFNRLIEAASAADKESWSWP